jgi:hypothetical protein
MQSFFFTAAWCMAPAGDFVAVITLLLLHRKVREKMRLVEHIHSNRSSSIQAFWSMNILCPGVDRHWFRCRRTDARKLATSPLSSFVDDPWYMNKWYGCPLLPHSTKLFVSHLFGIICSSTATCCSMKAKNALCKIFPDTLMGIPEYW